MRSHRIVIVPSSGICSGLLVYIVDNIVVCVIESSRSIFGLVSP